MTEPPQPPSALERLLGLYRRTFSSIFSMLASASGPLSRLRERAQGMLGDLEEPTAAMLEAEVPAAYQDGRGAALSALEEMGVSSGELSPLPDSGEGHRAAVQALAENLRDDLTEARMTVGRRVRGLIRDAQLQAGAESEREGETPEAAARRLAALLGERGIPAFTDSRGRRWDLPSYAEMASRSVLAEAQNRGHNSQLAEEGFDLVKITEHSPTCPICYPYQGRVYSISGESETYPPLSGTAFSVGFSTIHPNCRHRVTPWVEEFAEDGEEQRRMADEPFDTDRPEAMRRAYDEGQAKKRRQREARKQWRRYQTRLGEDAPSFPAFSRMKQADSQRYRELQAAYREAAEEV